MYILQIEAIVAGLLFGVWPILMNKSGLNGRFSPVIFALVMLICVTPFAIGNVGNLNKVVWTMAIGAPIFAAFGLMFLNDMLSKATSENVGPLVVLMILPQVLVPAVYDIMNNGKPTMAKFLGFTLSIVAGILLTL